MTADGSQRTRFGIEIEMTGITREAAAERRRNTSGPAAAISEPIMMPMQRWIQRGGSGNL